MKYIIVLVIMLFCARDLNAQEEHCRCSNDTISSEDPIIQKIPFGQPSIHFLKDTISSLNHFKFKRNFVKNEIRSIWVTVIDSEGKEVELQCGLDFSYNCETHEFEILKSDLIKIESIMEIYWIENR